MRWVFDISNHSDQSAWSARDLLDPIVGAMNAIGVDAEYGHSRDRRGLVIYSDGFTRGSAKSILKKDYDYALVATEFFNGSDKFDGHDMRRCKAFSDLAPRAKFIWSVVNCPMYKLFNRPYAYLPLGFEPSCYRRNETVPTHEICVYGAMNEDREALRGLLVARGISHIWLPYGTTKNARDEAIGRCKFVLGLPALNGSSALSPSRYSAALHADRPVLDAAVLESYSPGAFDWDDVRKYQLEEFSKLDMRQFVRDAIFATMTVGHA